MFEGNVKVGNGHLLSKEGDGVKVTEFSVNDEMGSTYCLCSTKELHLAWNIVHSGNLHRDTKLGCGGYKCALQGWVGPSAHVPKLGWSLTR